MYAKLNNGQVTKYPYTAQDLGNDNPNVSFPANLDDATLARFDAVRVVVTGAPEHDANTHIAEQIGCAFNQTTQRWETSWVIRPLTPAELAQRISSLKAGIVAQTQERLDAFARTREYDGILSACTYASSTMPKFRAEGQYCVDVRDLTWAKLYEMMAEVEAGTRPMPGGYEDIEAELPPLAWPAA